MKSKNQILSDAWNSYKTLYPTGRPDAVDRDAVRKARANPGPRPVRPDTVVYAAEPDRDDEDREYGALKFLHPSGKYGFVVSDDGHRALHARLGCPTRATGAWRAGELCPRQEQEPRRWELCRNAGPGGRMNRVISEPGIIGAAARTARQAVRAALQSSPGRPSGRLRHCEPRRARSGPRRDTRAGAHRPETH